MPLPTATTISSSCARFCVSEYGAQGDGVTDDTAAIQTAVDAAAAAGGGVSFPAGTYAVTEIRIKSGLAYLQGENAILKGTSAVPEGVITSNGAYYGGGNIDHVVISGFYIDCQNTARRGLFMSSLRYSVIEKLLVVSVPDGGSGIRLHYGCAYNTIRDNRVVLPYDNPFGTYTNIEGIYLVAETVDTQGGYTINADGTITYQSVTTYSNKVTNNHIYGGTHGIALNGSPYNVIADNHVQLCSHRAIILSPASRYNSITGNVCRDFGSSGIHMAYGSNNNVVSGNKLVSYVCDNGDNAGIITYVASNLNTISANQIEGNMFYGVYVADGTFGTSIEGNHILLGGTASFQVGVGVEADRADPPPAGAIYTRSGRTGLTVYTHTQEVSIIGNTFYGVDAGISLTQLNSSYNVLNTTIRDNVYQTTPTHEVFTFRDGGTVTLRATSEEEGTNVRLFGATGDGSTDDTEALQAAIDAAGVGGHVYFPAGDYRFSSTLLPQKYQTWSGDTYEHGLGTPSGTTLTYTGTSGEGVRLTNARRSSFTIKRMVIQNSAYTYTDATFSGAGSTAYGVMVDGNLTLEDVVLRLWFRAVEFVNSYYSRIFRCEINRCGAAFNAGTGNVFNLELHAVSTNLVNVVTSGTSTNKYENLKAMGCSFESWSSAFNALQSASFHGSYFETQNDVATPYGFFSSTPADDVHLALYGCSIFINRVERFVNLAGVNNATFISMGNNIEIGGTKVASGRSHYYLFGADQGEGRVVMQGDSMRVRTGSGAALTDCDYIDVPADRLGGTDLVVFPHADPNKIDEAILPSHKVWDVGGQVYNVKAYGAKGDGATDDSAAIQAAIDAADAASNGVVFFPPGTYNHNSSLQMWSNITLQGSGSGTTFLDLQTATKAIVSKTPGTRSYNWGIKDMSIVDSGGGTTGIELDSVSTSVFENLIVSGFTTGIDIYSPTSGYSVYNRFYNVNSSTNTTCFYLRGTSSNANTFIGCRANSPQTYGWRISDSNDNSMISCQAESGGNGATAFALEASGGGLTNNNKIIGCRVEAFNSFGTAFNVGTNVNDTWIMYPALFSTITTVLTDNGTRTHIWGIGGDNIGNQMYSALVDASGTPWLFERTTAASTNPAMIVRDSATTSGTPNTLQIETERSGGKFIRGVRGSTEYFHITAQGAADFAGDLSVEGITGTDLQVSNFDNGNNQQIKLLSARVQIVPTSDDSQAVGGWSRYLEWNGGGASTAAVQLGVLGNAGTITYAWWAAGATSGSQAASSNDVLRLYSTGPEWYTGGTRYKILHENNTSTLDIAFNTVTVGGTAPTVSTGELGLGGGTQVDVGGAGAATALPTNPRGYLVVNIAGTDRVIPYYDVS